LYRELAPDDVLEPFSARSYGFDRGTLTLAAAQPQRAEPQDRREVIARFAPGRPLEGAEPRVLDRVLCRIANEPRARRRKKASCPSTKWASIVIA
jgi:hypothetical protein